MHNPNFIVPARETPNALPFTPPPYFEPITYQHPNGSPFPKKTFLLSPAKKPSLKAKHRNAFHPLKLLYWSPRIKHIIRESVAVDP
jgi:hypothetical protein